MAFFAYHLHRAGGKTTFGILAELDQGNTLLLQDCNFSSTRKPCRPVDFGSAVRLEITSGWIFVKRVNFSQLASKRGSALTVSIK